jgi:hypothetical protein
MSTDKPKPTGDQGRFTKLTPEVQKSICTDIADGLDQKHAALRAGVAPRTVQHWLTVGRRAGETTDETEALCVAFLASYEKAVADAVAANVQLIQIVAREGTWQAAAWWLERRHPDLYGSDRKRVKELERLLAEIIKGGTGGAGNAHPSRRTKADRRPARRPR